MSTRIYLAVSKKDEKITKVIVSALKKADYSLYKRKTLQKIENMKRRISEVDLFVFMATSNSLVDKKCTEELRFALRARKPIIPIQIGEIKLPTALEMRNVLYFENNAQERSIQKIIHHMSWMLTENGAIQSLHDRLSDLVYVLDRGLTNNKNAIKSEIGYVENLIQKAEKGGRKKIDSMSPEIEQERENFRLKRIRSRSNGLEKVVGTPPLGLNDFFKDRVDVLAKVINFATNDLSTKAITIYGKGGVGKTALACEVMGKLFDNDLNIDGQVFLSTRSHLGINLEQIYLSIASLLNKEAEEFLINVWGDKSDINSKMEILREYIIDKKIIVLLDNFEDLLNFGGEIEDQQLFFFLTFFLKKTHDMKIIITSRERIVLPNDVRLYMDFVPLDSGLPVSDSISLLRSFDNDGYLRIKDCSPETLELLVKKVHGIPRALEAIAGILEQDPLISPIDIIQSEDGFSGIVESLISDAHNRLPPEALRVMQALAIFNRPVTINAIQYLLDPYIPIDDLKPIISKLARGKFIHIFNNTKEIVIHPLDREYSYNKIPS